MYLYMHTSTQERGNSTHETRITLEYNLFSQTSLTIKYLDTCVVHTCTLTFLYT